MKPYMLIKYQMQFLIDIISANIFFELLKLNQKIQNKLTKVLYSY